MNKFRLFCIAMILTGVAGLVEAGCTARTDSWGNTRYNCHDGNSGTSPQTVGETLEIVGLELPTELIDGVQLVAVMAQAGKLIGRGTTRYNDGTTSRTDSWGNTRFSDGTVCRTDSWGTVRCD